MKKNPPSGGGGELKRLKPNGEEPDVGCEYQTFLLEKELTGDPYFLNYETMVEERRDRLHKIMNGDIVHGREGHNEDPAPIKLQDEFDKFCERIPAWKDGGSYVFWRDHSNVKDKEGVLVVRVQNSGLCYMHAPAALQHYVVTMNSGGTHHEMLNVAKFMKQYFTARQLFKHIVHCEGGHSVGFMQQIMQLDDEDIESFYIPKHDGLLTATAAGIHDALQEYGVGLVSGFNVDATFHESELASFVTEKYNSKKKKGKHAMVLVGSRKDGDQHIFLLQNWWRTRQLIEVSGEYLAQTGAQVVFVKKSVDQIPDEFPKNVASYMETEDLGEQLPPEMMY